MHGKGVFKWRDGRRYEGDYVEVKTKKILDYGYALTICMVISYMVLLKIG